MPTFTKLMESVGARKDMTTVGQVIGKNLDGSFQVQIGTRSLKAKSGIGPSLKPNSQVIVGSTSDGMYIVGMSNLRIKSPTEIIVNG